MIQGGIEGSLDDVFRFGDAHLAPLDSRLRENDGSFAKVSPFEELGHAPLASLRSLAPLSPCERGIVVAGRMGC